MSLRREATRDRAGSRRLAGAQAIETLVIAIVLAIGIRTFFLQPCRITSGSMEPTLWVADRLLIDRVSYNFRQPRRGEIVVFASAGLQSAAPDLPPVAQDQVFTKRLVGLPGERIRIGDDRHLVVEGVRLDRDHPRFRDLYSFDPGQAPRPRSYVGHLNAATAARYLEPGRPNPAPRFPTAETTLRVRPGHLLVLGDNSLDSLDGRAWGDFPVGHLVGKVAFAYWPISPRCLRRIR
jgi:signal peptidase I